MAKLVAIHPQNPQQRLIMQVVEELHSGGVIAYPTDSGYALGTTLGNKNGLDKIRQIRQLSKRHDFTLMMRDLSHIGEYAKLDNNAFRLLKKILPGAYTFILAGTRDVPKRLLHEKKKTIGVRVSSHGVVQALLAALDEPLMSVSLILEGCEFYDIDDVRDAVDNQVDLIIDDGYCPPEPTTVIDLSGDAVEIIRHGAGDTSLLE
ncbi:L-threonylcarbamoyladenylate synthase [Candidatus Thioglobus sp.]|uniref:L-threonylcarbamoyladenylate synthase n=1 Tax=Candidatus Thioglobus sp. TaxID=2026721 RepID=UPI001E0B3EE7|nr:L-threonylcarbamoyladenylate synthase [Candidatus Thioglobus sp.]MBT3277449.1 threonylcarbamoyl-AMP synthase [Candidatus Thioglobus sp.]MBT3447074.1 threonylcarbamoyl-AMP synthase [Candidatus Thioglobus sp.]MBT3745016.1 threonylcarbamoyl-AMP synthase [Candidatus Thioglobus sp.]MBT4000973.1 threonylcarbamoyl-AMP synthase [Candidatus Thioglobus sp.]MBT4182222.1 threonylcarbamoyl-AMP synthase [Candidatus Thioglobus sp.]